MSNVHIRTECFNFHVKALTSHPFLTLSPNICSGQTLLHANKTFNSQMNTGCRDLKRNRKSSSEFYYMYTLSKHANVFNIPFRGVTMAPG